jgi:predicted  nucleic acid-binding Zn-ribbon protein
MAFFDVAAAGGWKVWGLIASAALVVIGGGLTVYDQAGGDIGNPKGAIPLKCSAEGCTWTKAVSMDEELALAKKDYEAWKTENPGKQPININEMAMRDMFMPGGVQKSPEEMMENMILVQWGTYENNLPFTCPTCSQKTVFRAYQCAKCGNIFFLDDSKDFPDTCPKCTYSKRKERREASAAEKTRKSKK